MNSLKLYLRYIEISLKSQMQYKTSFVMVSIGYFFTTIIEFFAVWVLFFRFGSLGIWTLSEVALFYGMTHTAFALSEAWSRGFDIFHRQVKSGDFDRILLRPRSTVLQVIGQELQLVRLGKLAQGIIVLVWGLSVLNQTLTAGQIILIVVSILSGSVLFSGIFILQATISFWSIESLEIARSITNGGVQTTQYPLSIYIKWFRRFFIFIIPLASINYFPLLGILDKAEAQHYPGWISWLSPFIGIIFFFISLRVWHFGVKHYRSTGS